MAWDDLQSDGSMPRFQRFECQNSPGRKGHEGLLVHVNAGSGGKLLDEPGVSGD